MKHNKPYMTKSPFLCSEIDEQKERINAREGSLPRRNITQQPTLARGRTFFTRDGSWAKGEAVRCLVYCVPLTNSVKTLLQSFLTSFFLPLLAQDYKARSLRWEKAVAVWRQFHCDLKDVTSWMTHAEKVLEDTSGEIEFNAAKKEQKVRRFELL